MLDDQPLLQELEKAGVDVADLTTAINERLDSHAGEVVHVLDLAPLWSNQPFSSAEITASKALDTSASEVAEALSDEVTLAALREGGFSEWGVVLEDVGSHAGVLHTYWARDDLRGHTYEIFGDLHYTLTFVGSVPHAYRPDTWAEIVSTFQSTQ